MILDVFTIYTSTILLKIDLLVLVQRIYEYEIIIFVVIFFSLQKLRRACKVDKFRPPEIIGSI